MTDLIGAAAILKDIIIWDCRNLYKNSNSDNEVIYTSPRRLHHRKAQERGLPRTNNCNVASFYKPG